MKQNFKIKNIIILIQAVIAFFALMSLFFCFSYYTWADDKYKTRGFEYLGIFFKDYTYLESALLISVILFTTVLTVNILRFIKTKLLISPLNAHLVSFFLATLSLLGFISGLIVFINASGFIAITTISACGVSRIYKGAGSYLYLIFTAGCLVLSITDAFITRRRTTCPASILRGTVK